MKSVKRKKRHLTTGSIIISIYMCVMLLSVEAYAMSDGMLIYVKTLGELGNNILEEAGINNSLMNISIIRQQNKERVLETSIDIKKPVEIVNGLETRYRSEIKVNDKEKEILYRIVEAEAGGEDISGKMLVANVVLNRVKSERFPNTVKEVVFAHSGSSYQFSPVSDGRYYSVKVSKETKDAVNRAILGEDNSKGAEYFMCRSKSDTDNLKWFDNSLKFLFKYGSHEFFKK